MGAQTNTLRFTKMHGLGNDFAVLDGVRQQVTLSREQIRRLGDRHLGIGFDQLLLVEPAGSTGVDFRYRIFNSDGEEVEQCGNGARCLGRFVRDQGLTESDRLLVETTAGRLGLELRSDGQVTVDMGTPQFEPGQIPFIAPARADSYDLELDGRHYQVGAVSLGNPHLVLRVDDVEQAPVATLGPALERHRRFPNRVNVGFLQVIDRAHARLRVFERGVGETRACGSGACAAAVVGRVQGLLGTRVEMALRGGTLLTEWDGEGSVRMTGPATRVFEGSIVL